MGLSWMEIGLFLMVVVVVFGGSNQLPDLARSVGQAIGEFKRAMNPETPVVPPEENDEDTDSSPEQSDPPSA